MDKYADENAKLRQRITRLFKRIDAGKYKCKCGGKLVAQVEQYDGRSTGEHVWLHCSRERCRKSTRWYCGFELLKAFKEWQSIQRRKR